ncbi:MAG: Fic family protein [Pseudomonadota bacterium]|nr:Fic family protein [Pseudomonadota bacterium]
MKLPLPPPPLDEILAQVDPGVLLTLLSTPRSPLCDGHYLHWDELRHRPPPAALTHELWWLNIKLARAALAQVLPLVDRDGQPFQFAMPEPALRALHFIDRDAAGQILMDAPVASPHDRDRYLVSSLIEESITSSQLEGASTTRRVAEDMLRAGRRPCTPSERMIFNNYQAMQHIRAIGQKPLTPALILELHQRLTAGTLEDPADVGRWRLTDDVHVVDPRDGKLLHIPPTAISLPERMQRLCDFANGNETDTPYVHPVVRAILLHFMLGYDHPFADGNGRTARALFYWAMARQGYWLMAYLSISNILRRAPGQYARAYLHTETDTNDTTYFLLHQLDVIRQAIDALHGYLKEKTQETRSTERLLEGAQLRSLCNHRQIALLSHALKHADALYTVESHRASHAVAYATARADLLQLAQLGVLQKTGEGKRFVFTVPADLHTRLTTLQAPGP